MAKLVVNPSSSQKREVSLPRTVLSIGRDPSNDLVLPDAMVSRRHAVVEWRGGQFFIRDCNSSNGSLVNGDRVSERGLRDGDLVAIGTARLLFRDDVVEEPGAKVVQHPSAPRLQCPSCNADYRKGDLFCRQCGASVAPPPPQKAVCASCGTAVVLPARFCNACGRLLSSDAAQPPASAPAPVAGGGSAAVAPAAEALTPAPPEAVAHAEAEPEVLAPAEPKAVEPQPDPAPEPASAPPPPDPPLGVTVPEAPSHVTLPQPLPVASPPRASELLRTTVESPRPPRLPAARPARPGPARPPAAADAQLAAQPASAGARLAAACVDAIVVGVLLAVILGPVALYWRSRALPTDAGQVPFLPIALSLAAIPVALLIGAGYYVWGWGVAGATPGKKLVGLAVETRDGRAPIGAACAFVRLLGYVVSALPLGLGFLLIPLAGEGLHDKLAGTRVVSRKE